MRLLWLALAAAVTLSASAIFAFSMWAEHSYEIQGERLVLIERGMTLKQVAARLQAEDVIENPTLFQLLALVRRSASKLKAGEYSFSKRQTPSLVLAALEDGAVTHYFVTIPEGATFSVIQSALRSGTSLIDDVSTYDVTTVLDDLERDALTAHGEGFFFPDTYQYQYATSASDILKRAHALMQEELQQVWARRNTLVSVQDAYELLIVASLIEKETGFADDRVRIAGVIYRRLEKRMPLQIDAAVIYAIGAAFDGNIRQRDLDRKHPYNTYTTQGLPPTPICTPSRASLEAAANPVDEDVMYWVARGDGTSQFSRTYREHRAAVRKYQRN